MEPFTFSCLSMDPNDVPLVDELASALNAARQELRRLASRAPDADLTVTAQADQAIGRFELERDRTDLDAATLPARLVITVQEGAISSVLTDSRLPLEVAIIDYDVEADWNGEDMVSVPQTNGHPDVMAMGFLLRPTLLPERTLQLHRAVYRAGCNAYNTTEH